MSVLIFLYCINLYVMQNVRKFGKCIMEQVSNTQGLASSLKFLCSYGSSLSAVLLGLRHAVKLVILLLHQIS